MLKRTIIIRTIDISEKAVAGDELRAGEDEDCSSGSIEETQDLTREGKLKVYIMVQKIFHDKRKKDNINLWSTKHCQT